MLREFFRGLCAVLAGIAVALILVWIIMAYAPGLIS
jgi:hypothetical protein